MFDRLIDLVIELIGFIKFIIPVYPYQAGICLRFGKFHHVLKPGFRFYIPFGIDKILTDSVVLETIRVGPQSLTTADGCSLVVSTIISFRIDDIKIFLLEVENRNHLIQDSAYGFVSEFIVSRTWAELQDLNLTKELTKAVRRQAKKYGADIVSVQVSDLQRCKSFRFIGQQPQLGEIK